MTRPTRTPEPGLPARVRIHEVGPRDGLQNEKAVVPVEVKSEFIHRLADAGSAVFVSSHVMDEADRCDRLLLMRDGRIIADGAPHEIRQKTGADDIESAFLAIVEAAA